MLLFIFRICDLVNLPQIKTFLPISASKHISHRTLWKTLRRQKMAKALLGSFSAPLCLFLHVLFHLCPSRFSQRTSACKFLSSSLFNELFSLAFSAFQNQSWKSFTKSKSFKKMVRWRFFEEIFAKSVLHSLDSFAELSTFDNCKNLCKLDNMGMNLHPYFSSPRQGVFYILSTFHH